MSIKSFECINQREKILHSKTFIALDKLNIMSKELVALVCEYAGNREEKIKIRIEGDYNDIKIFNNVIYAIRDHKFIDVIDFDGKIIDSRELDKNNLSATSLCLNDDTIFIADVHSRNVFMYTKQGLLKRK